MRLHSYAAGEGAAQTREVEPSAVLGDAVAVDADERVYRVGDEVELDVKVTVVELFGEQSGHVVVHKCRDIAVTVAYGGTERLLHVHPAIRIRTVRAQAIKAFGIAHEEASDLVLRLPGATEDLGLAEPIGSFVPKGSCAVALDLVHAVRAQG